MFRRKSLRIRVSAILIKDGKILLIAHKKNNDVYWLLPGGGVNFGESLKHALKREIKEELGVSINNIVFFGNFSGKSIFDDRIIDLHAYVVDLSGELKPQSEIEELKWINKDYNKQGIKVGSLLEDFIIPKLIQNKMIR